MEGRSHVHAALIVHAGAWDVPEGEKEAHRRACRRAVAAGWDVLRGGGIAREAVQAAVEVFEDDPAVNAGRGSVLCRGGWVEMDAALMEGTDLAIGAVACVRDVPNPVRLAAAVLGTEEVLLVGEGAVARARAAGVARCAPEDLVEERERARLAAWREAGRTGAARDGTSPADTVGAVALDETGAIAVATSTGGRPGKPSGRVGDAAIPGCGFYADDRAAGAACTGWGEHILRASLARRAVDLAREHGAQDAAWLAVREMADRIDGRGGLIVLRRDGSLGYAFNTGSMPVAYVDGEMAEPVLGGT